jgi:hypothetical protein
MSEQARELDRWTISKEGPVSRPNGYVEGPDTAPVEVVRYSEYEAEGHLHASVITRLMGYDDEPDESVGELVYAALEGDVEAIADLRTHMLTMAVKRGDADAALAYLGDVLAAVAFLFGDQMRAGLYERLADADEELRRRVAELMELRVPAGRRQGERG